MKKLHSEPLRDINNASILDITIDLLHLSVLKLHCLQVRSVSKHIITYSC